MKYITKLQKERNDFIMFFNMMLCLVFLAMGCFIGEKFAENKKKYVLVERNVGITGPSLDIQVETLHFKGKIYNKVDPLLVDEEHFFIPAKGTALYINRKIFKKMYPDGTYSYDYNGYDTLTDGEMARAFVLAQQKVI